MTISTGNLSQTTEIPGMNRQSSIPVQILESKLMSTTSNADECYVNQRFSNKLQAYLIGYVGVVLSEYSIMTT